MSSLLLSLGPAAWMPGVARHAPVVTAAIDELGMAAGDGKGQHWLVDVTPASENLLEGPAPELTPRDVVEAQCDAMKRADVEHFWKFVAPECDLAIDYAHPQGAQTNFNWKVRNEPRWKNIARRPQAALYTMRDFRIVGTVFTDADKMLVRVSASPYFPDAPGAEAETHFVFTLGRMRASSTARRDGRAPRVLDDALRRARLLQLGGHRPEQRRARRRRRRWLLCRRRRAPPRRAERRRLPAVSCARPRHVHSCTPHITRIEVGAFLVPNVSYTLITLTRRAA